MQLSKALFCFAVLCITVTLADFRHIPERSNMFCEQNHSSLMPFLRHLDSPIHNSQDKSSSVQKTEPVTVRLQGSTELGYYYVTLFLGTPVQKQTFIVDTGSVTTTVPCVECGNDCGKKHFDKPFNNDDSKSFEMFKCNEGFGEYTCYDCSQHCPFSVSYVEGSSYKGHFNKDFISFGNEIEDNYPLLKQNTKNLTPEAQESRNSIEEIIEQRKVFMPFGCTNKETKLFYDQEADGILGLGVNTNTRNSPPNILDALNIHNSNFSKVFSLCLAQEGGYFTLGGHNAAYHLPHQKTQYTEYSDAFGQYKVFISRIEMEGENIGLKPSVLNSGEGAFFDSGTTLTHAPQATYGAIRGNLKSYCRGDDDRCGKQSETTSFCYKYNPSDFSSLAEFYKTFPTFTFVFGKEGKANYEWRAEDYLYLKEETENEYCLGLSHYERETILGGTFMRNHDILFDKEKKRVGFARADCGAVQAITKPTYFEKKETIEQVDRPAVTGENFATDSTEDQENNNDFWKALMKFDKALKVAMFVLLASGVVAALVCLLRRVRNKKRAYQQMGTGNVEIQSAGINGRPLNASAAETPQLKKDQPAQEEKPEFEFSQEESNPEIRVD